MKHQIAPTRESYYRRCNEELRRFFIVRICKMRSSGYYLNKAERSRIHRDMSNQTVGAKLQFLFVNTSI